MKFTPLSQNELEEMAVNRPLLPDGIYKFQIIESMDWLSKNGHDMIKIKLNIYTNEGQFYVVTDYLLESMAFKLNHFCKATGLFKYYEQGMLDSDICLYKEGQVKIGTQKGKPKPDGSGNYPDQNTVKDYIVIEPSSVNDSIVQKPHVAFEGQEDDPDIPF